MTKKEFREKIGKIICPLENLVVECVYCHKGRGCPDEWPDIADKVNSIISAFRENGYVQLDQERQEGRREVVEAVENQIPILRECDGWQEQKKEWGLRRRKS